MLAVGKMDDSALHNEHDIQDYEGLQKKGLGGFRVIVTTAVIRKKEKENMNSLDH